MATTSRKIVGDTTPEELAAEVGATLLSTLQDLDLRNTETLDFLANLKLALDPPKHPSQGYDPQLDPQLWLFDQGATPATELAQEIGVMYRQRLDDLERANNQRIRLIMAAQQQGMKQSQLFRMRFGLKLREYNHSIAPYAAAEPVPYPGDARADVAPAYTFHREVQAGLDRVKEVQHHILWRAVRGEFNHTLIDESGETFPNPSLRVWGGYLDVDRTAASRVNRLPEAPPITFMRIIR